MRFSLFPLLIASAGLAHHVTATPLRVAVTEMTNIRFGHAVANANTDHGDSNSNNNDNIAHGMLITSSITELDDAGRPKMQRRPCGGGGLKANVVSISNTFRKALGLPVIDTHPNLVAVNTADDGVHIVPVPGSHYQHHAEGHYKVRHYRGTFMRRVHHALMALGPWEGRAVAFVLGCGIGVLLRMFWVIAIISYRLIRGPREEDEYPEEVIFIADSQELILPPPQYTDEKLLPVDVKPAIA